MVPIEPPVETIYRCKKCRTILGSSRNVLPHSTKQHPTWFSLLDWDSRRSVECRQGVFMEPIASTMSRVCQVSTQFQLNQSNLVANLAKIVFIKAKRVLNSNPKWSYTLLMNWKDLSSLFSQILVYMVG